MSTSDNNTSADQSSSRSDSSGNNNRNRNRNRNRGRNRGGEGGNREGGGNRDNRGQGRSQGRGGRGGNGRRTGGRRPAPKPLTLWEKIKKFFGLYTPITGEPQRIPRKQAAKKEGQGRQPREGGQGRQPREGGQGRQPREKREPREDTRGDDRPARTRKPRRETPDTSDVTSRRLYVGNLSYEAAEHDVEDLFKGVGTVRNIDIVYNRNTHRSKGYGFVTMSQIEESKRAVEVLHDQPFMGRTLIVNVAKSDGPEGSDGVPTTPVEEQDQAS
ncbi:RNA-binding protein [Akkermansiaceae bacterium]|nr:RNA-binding protein [bacterium]MDB4639978.1 RNA-binding protein [Akkermansiaceae bacterium]